MLQTAKTWESGEGGVIRLRILSQKGFVLTKVRLNNWELGIPVTYVVFSETNGGPEK